MEKSQFSEGELEEKLESVRDGLEKLGVANWRDNAKNIVKQLIAKRKNYTKFRNAIVYRVYVLHLAEKDKSFIYVINDPEMDLRGWDILKDLEQFLGLDPRETYNQIAELNYVIGRYPDNKVSATE